MGEEEWPEYLLQLEAAAARARLKVKPRPATRWFEGSSAPELASAEAGS
jgi:hypothetical protein